MNKIILLIEDNADMRDNISEILELAKYKVHSAANGKEGVRLAQSLKPDLIICDIMMPELDGYGVLHMLGKDPATASIPFIFLTAKSEKTDYRKGMGLGADDYITKPFDDTELLDAVEIRLKKYDILKTEYSKTAEGFTEFLDTVRGLDELKKLSEESKPKHYSKKEIIYMEGSTPNRIYFVTKGKVKTYKANDDGKEYIVSLYTQGDFFGYNPLLENMPYTDSAMPMEDSELVVVYKEDFFALLLNNRDVALKFIKMLSNDVTEKEERLIRLAYNSVRKRVADALVTLHDRYAKDKKEIFSMEILREDLANMVGTSTESVIRTLSDFKEEKLIEIKGSTITFLNFDKIKRIRN